LINIARTALSHLQGHAVFSELSAGGRTLLKHSRAYNVIRFRQNTTVHQLLLLRGLNQNSKNSRIVAAACLSQPISASLSPKLTRSNEHR
jgi:hypothetical protein